MAADGSRGPRPFVQRRVSTTFLRVPVGDWPAVKRGYKTEFRNSVGKNNVPRHFTILTPTPVIAYAIRNGRYDAELMWLEEAWQEPLGAIGPDSLRREGFASLAEFRTYWIKREHKRFTPTRKVFAYRVRAFRAADVDEAATLIFEHLYGEFLNGQIREAA